MTLSELDRAGGDPRPEPSNDAPVVDSAGMMRPGVAGSGGGGGLWLGIGAVIAVGLVVFLWLSGHRAQAPRDLAAQSEGAASPIAPPPPAPQEVVAMETAARTLAVAPPAPPVIGPPPTLPPVKPETVAEPAPPRAPVLVVDLAEQTAAPANAAAPATASPSSANAAGAKPGAAPNTGLSGDEQFAARIESGGAPDRARATILGNKSSVIAQGAMIPAVLETALDSDLPGFARAVVSRDVRSFDGLAVLIPRGSRVIGEYRTATSQAQSRAFVIWTRVLRPDGVSIQIGSPATDPLGRAGLAGSIDHHFFERFGGAVLLSVVNAGATALAGAPSTEVVIGSSQEATGIAATASAFAPANIAPTIKVPQGAPIRIFVARDLDFAPVSGGHE